MAKIGFYAYLCRLSLYISHGLSMRHMSCAAQYIAPSSYLSFSFFSSASTSSRFFCSSAFSAGSFV